MWSLLELHQGSSKALVVMYMEGPYKDRKTNKGVCICVCVFVCVLKSQEQKQEQNCLKLPVGNPADYTIRIITQTRESFRQIN